MGWNTIEMKKLKCAKPQCDAHLITQPVVRSLQRCVYLLIQRRLPAQSSHHEICAKISIHGWQHFDLPSAQQFIAMTLISLNFHKNIEGCRACRGNCNRHGYVNLLAALQRVSAKKISDRHALLSLRVGLPELRSMCCRHRRGTNVHSQFAFHRVPHHLLAVEQGACAK